MDPKKAFVRMDQGELAMYEAGRAKGQVEGIEEAIRQLKAAANHYQTAFDAEELTEDAHQTGAKYLGAFTALGDAIKKELEKITPLVKLRLDLALALRGEKTKPLSTRVKNAIMGFRNGWNE